MENQLENDIVGDKTGGEMETSFGVATAAPVGGPDDVTEAEGDADGRCYVPPCGTLYYVMGFFALFCVYTQRTCLSVAIVAMVNHTAVNDAAEVWSNATNVTASWTDQCRRDEALQHADGEFTWDRHQQAAALAMFSYGQVFSQVCTVFPEKSQLNKSPPFSNNITRKFTLGWS